MFGIAFRNRETGHISYYTGKAGGDWLSPDAKECFFAYSRTGASFKGRRMLTLHSFALANHEFVPVAHPCSEDSEGGTCD